NLFGIDRLDGVVIHNNCDKGRLESFDRFVRQVEQGYHDILRTLDCVSLGGGLSFMPPDNQVVAFCDRLHRYAQDHVPQVYREPGEAAVRHTTTLEVSVLDVGFRGKNLAVVDSSTEAHMLYLLIYRETAPIGNDTGEHTYEICGKTCLAGDIFG